MRLGPHWSSEERMDYRNGTAVDTYGCIHVRTLNSIEPERLAQAYLRLCRAL